MKAFYEIPELEIVEFEVEDIITTSVGGVDPDVTEPTSIVNNGDNLDEGWDDVQ